MSTRRKYFRSKQEKKVNEKPDETEIRVTAKEDRGVGRYIARAAILLKGYEDQKQLQFVILKATGGAISKAFNVVEILKMRIKGLHQVYCINHIEVTDVFEPKEEGLDIVRRTRNIPLIEIKLTLNPTAEDKKLEGYQEPIAWKEDMEELSVKQIIEFKRNRQGGGNRKSGDEEERGERRGGRGDRRGGRGDRRGGYNRQRSSDRDQDRDEGRRRDNRDNRDRGDRQDRGDRGEYKNNQNRSRNNRDSRDNRDNRDHRDNRDNRDNRDRENRDQRGDRNERGDKKRRGGGDKKEDKD